MRGAQFVGRDVELRETRAVLEAARAGRGSLVVVAGEIGIGKSSLCRELADTAQAMGFRVATARCWVEGGAPPLWPWQPLLTQLAGAEAAALLAGDAGHSDVDPDRFARFEAVTQRLAETCAETPVCAVIDDIHAADLGTLLLTRFVARSLPRSPLVLVLGRRTGEPDAEDARSRQLAEIEAEGSLVHLGPFDLDEATAFLAAQGLTELDDDLVVALHRLTKGNPLFLSRVTALGRTVEPDALVGGVREAITRAIDDLSEPTRRILRTSAVLGSDPAVMDTARLTRTEPVDVLNALDEAAAAGLVTRPSETGHFAFGHELVRSVLEDGLGVAARLDAHARAAEVARAAGDGPAATPERLARRAHHALAAAARSPDDARTAVAACRDAARAMVRSFAYEQADDLLSAAVDLHTQHSLGPPPAELLVEWAQAALHPGLMKDARERFVQAAEAAEREGDAVLLAHAALGLGGYWVNEQRTAVERARVLGLQRAALERLPADQVSLRCRLQARLAAEAVFDGGPIEPVLEALDAARACGDPRALAEALSLSCHALFTPHRIAERRGLADELVQVASEAGADLLGLMGLCWRTADLFQTGDPAALPALEDLRQRATALACQNILYVVGCMDVMLLVREGRLEEAEALAHDCFKLGDAVGEVDAVAYLSSHMLVVRWLQGRDAELADMAEEVASSPTLRKDEFAFRAVAALLAARAGRVECARAKLDALTMGGLASLVPTTGWMIALLAIAETAAIVGNPGPAREVYDLLKPFADLPTIGSVGIVCLGSTERGLGVAARTFGDLDLAIGHFERAVTANQRLGNRPFVAVARAELASALMARGGEGDRERAAELLDVAIAAGESMQMGARVAAWRAEREALGDVARPRPDRAEDPVGDGVGDRAGDRAGAGADRRGPGVGRPRRGVLVRGDGWWELRVDGRHARVPDLVGMRYLAELLTHPGQPIPALGLATHGVRPDDSPRHALLDHAARSAYARRARELADELEEAEANNDVVRSERLRLEMETLVDTLMAATAPDGRSRSFVDDAERARVAVRKAITRALDSIVDADRELAEHIERTVQTGSKCLYLPDADEPITWTMGASDASVTHSA
ncbi:MAG TPA: AAA family ATPase [Acidimicrobiales bacterium]